MGKKKKEFGLNLYGLRAEVARRVSRIAGRHVDNSQVTNVLSEKRGSRYAELIRETARQVAIEMGGKS